MKQYIERAVAIAHKREYNLGGSYDNTEYAVPLEEILSIPAADVRLMVRGKWKKADVQPYFRKHFDIFVCSNCHARGQTKWNFCPNCGAEMR